MFSESETKLPDPFKGMCVVTIINKKSQTIDINIIDINMAWRRSDINGVRLHPFCDTIFIFPDS